MNYWDHPSYGNENMDHKTVTLTLQKPLARKTIETMDENGPQLDVKFPEMSYTDGDKENGFSHGWEKTDITPRGLIDYSVSKNEIKIRASEAITPQLFIESVRYILSELAKTEDAAVAKVNTNGLAVSVSGTTLSEIGQSIDVAQRTFKGRPAPKSALKPGL